MNLKSTYLLLLGFFILTVVIVCSPFLARIVRAQEAPQKNDTEVFTDEGIKANYEISASGVGFFVFDYVFISDSCIKIIDNDRIICGSFVITPLSLYSTKHSRIEPIKDPIPVEITSVLE